MALVSKIGVVVGVKMAGENTLKYTKINVDKGVYVIFAKQKWLNVQSAVIQKTLCLKIYRFVFLNQNCNNISNRLEMLSDRLNIWQPVR